MNEAALHARLLDLLSSKDFEILSIEEKEFIFSALSEQEYKDLRLFHLSSLETVRKETTAPSPSVKKQLDRAFEKKYTPSFSFGEFVNSILRFNIPAYQAALGCIAIVLAFSWFRWSSHELSTSSGLIAIADTVIIEKETPGRIDTVYIVQKEKNETVPATERSSNIRGNSDSLKDFPKEIAFPESQKVFVADFKQIESPGKTIKEDSMPTEFMVGIL